MKQLTAYVNNKKHSTFPIFMFEGREMINNYGLMMSVKDLLSSQSKTVRYEVEEVKTNKDMDEGDYI